mmetsp:Transcript_21004/g.38906  ORF Transcript_21004/g.38906 Transcript_21004/m.38906 type:complete len:361 (-) Transcript_21004:55-1137(-)
MASPLTRFTQDFYSVFRNCSPSLLNQLNIKRKLSTESNSSASTSNSNSPSTILDIDKSVTERAMTKAGSKQIQRVLGKSRPEDIDAIVEGVKDKIGLLMTDVYGNYMCQKLFQTCSSGQRLELLQAMESSLVKISMDTRGTHSLQILIGLGSLAEEEDLYERAFRGHVIRLSRHEFGSHVIQKLAMTLRNRDFIVRPVTQFVRELALDQLGLCVVKQIIDSPEVYKAILPHCLELIQDPYGNYAVQRLLEVWGKTCHTALEAQLSSKIVQLSIQKYSSNVIEQCLAEPSLGSQFAKKLIKTESLHVLLPNVYGCYVLKALKELFPKLSTKLVENIQTALERIHKNKLKGRKEQIKLLLSK